MKYIFKLLRVKHYIKNFLIFLPIFFSSNIFNLKLLVNTMIGFFVFSFVASVIYIINDINDLERDKLHPIKKNRPIASGKISLRFAKIIVIILFIIAFFGMYFLYLKTNNIMTCILPLMYLILNYAYSKKLKNIPVIDVAIIVIGFVLRTIYGATIISVNISNWLYLMIMFGSFYLGFGKRRNEIIHNGNKSRKVLQLYSKEFLDKNMYVNLGLSIMAYSMWCIDETTVLRVGNNYLVYTIPIFIIILQMYSLIIEGDSQGDPTDVIFNDYKLISIIIIYTILMFAIIYIF